MVLHSKLRIAIQTGKLSRCKINFSFFFVGMETVYRIIHDVRSVEYLRCCLILLQKWVRDSLLKHIKKIG